MRVNAAFVYAVCVVAGCYDVGLCALCRACGAPCFGEVLTLVFVYAYIGCVEYFVRYRANKAHDVRWVAREKGKGPE